MAAKLPIQLRALYASTTRHRLLSPRFPNPNEAFRDLLLGSNGRLFSDAPSPPQVSFSPSTLVPPPSGPNTSAPSSLNEKELAKFFAIAETWIWIH